MHYKIRIKSTHWRKKTIEFLFLQRISNSYIAGPKYPKQYHIFYGDTIEIFGLKIIFKWSVNNSLKFPNK